MRRVLRRIAAGATLPKLSPRLRASVLRPRETAVHGFGGGRAPSSRPCPCGNPQVHMAAKRTTVDGVLVLLWSDGQVYVGTSPLREPLLDLAATLFLGDVEVYDRAEVSLLARAARAAVAEGGPNPLARMRYLANERPRIA